MNEEETYKEAVQIVRETGLASISLLQRRLMVGYPKAAKLIDRMKEEGIAGPSNPGEYKA